MPVSQQQHSQSRVKSASSSSSAKELVNDSSDRSPQAITPSSISRNEESALEVTEKHEDIEGKPVMPRAKRIISFDDQTSRLSRSKLVVV